MSKSIIVSKHGAIRMKERIGNTNCDKAFLRNVIQNGKTRDDFRGELYYFILNKESKNDKKIKIYKNNVYIFNKNSHKLITAYPLPEYLIPIDKYEYSEEEQEKIKSIAYSLENIIDVQTKDNVYSGLIYFFEDKPLENLEIVFKNKSAEIKLSDIIKLDIGYNKYEFNY